MGFVRSHPVRHRGEAAPEAIGSPSGKQCETPGYVRNQPFLRHAQETAIGWWTRFDLNLCHIGEAPSTNAALRRHGVQNFGPNRCTGLHSTTLFWREFPGRCFPCSAGSRMEFA